MARKILLFLLCSLFIGCSGRNKDSLAYLFPEKIELRSEPCKIQSDDILSPLYFAFASDYLISANFRTEKCIRVYDMATGKPVNDMIYMGRGPGELLDVSSMYCFDNQLTVYSGNARRVLTIPYDELRNAQPKMTVADSIEDCFRLMPVAYDQYILEGCANGDHLKLVDKNGNYLLTIAPYPDDRGQNYPGDNRLIYQGQLAASPDGKHFAFAAASGIIFKFGEVRGKGSVSKTKEYVIALPEYTLNSDPTDDRYSVRWEESCLAGALSVTASNKYCFFLQDEHKSKTDRDWRMSTVLIFDWEGNPITKFHLDKQLEDITYNERENALIGITVNEQGQPFFVSYRLHDLNK